MEDQTLNKPGDMSSAFCYANTQLFGYCSGKWGALCIEQKICIQNLSVWIFVCTFTKCNTVAIPTDKKF